MAHSRPSDKATVPSLSPCNGFPEEILSNVLQLSVANAEDLRGTILNPLQNPLRLLLVCRQWTSVINRSPRFWGLMLAAAQSKEAWKTVFAKSKNAPITLRTAPRLPIPMLAEAIGRAAEAYLADDSPSLSWNDVLSSQDSLPMLQVLHLSRGTHNHIPIPLIIKAPSLVDLAIDGPATLVASNLQSMQFNRLRADMFPLLTSVLLSCPELRSVVVRDVSGYDNGLWQACLDCMEGSRITSLTVDVGEWPPNAPSPSTALPALTRLCISTPTIIHSSNLEVVDAEMSVTQLMALLAASPSIRSLVVSCPRSGRVAGPIRQIILPRCRTIVVDDRRSLDDGVVDLLSSIYSPLLQNMIMRTRPVQLVRPSPNVTHPDDRTPSCLRREMYASAKRKSAERFSLLSTNFECHMHGEVYLNIETDCTSGRCACITFRVEDDFIRNDNQTGIEVRHKMDGIFCETRHKHTQLMSVSYMLSMFSWPSISTVVFKTATRSTRTPPDQTMYPDPFVAISEGEKTALLDNLELDQGEWWKTLPPGSTLFDEKFFNHYDWNHEDGDECIRLLEFGARVQPNPSLLLKAISLLKMFVKDPAGGTVGPAFEEYPGLRAMVDMIDHAIQSVGGCVNSRNLGIINFSLRSVYVLYSLYSLRQRAMYYGAMLSYEGRLVREDEAESLLVEKSKLAYQSEHIVRNLAVVDDIVERMYNDMHRGRLSHEMIVNVSGFCLKLNLLHIEQRSTAGHAGESTFFTQMRRDRSYQSYEFLLRGITWPGIVGEAETLREIIITAELQTRPHEGIEVQQRFIRRLFGRTQVSRKNYMLTHDLWRFAIRNPYTIWTDSHNQCLWDWGRAHKPACAIYTIEALPPPSDDDQSNTADDGQTGADDGASGADGEEAGIDL
ncbi:unnamed protein product [Peniophora sp. CBMAI 1063]|nr:unnamed protein product [Peniophora sp. CBMAI 1063]